MTHPKEQLTVEQLEQIAHCLENGRQCDEEGVMTAVPRQAAYEAAQYLRSAALSALAPVSVPEGKPVAWREVIDSTLFSYAACFIDLRRMPKEFLDGWNKAVKEIGELIQAETHGIPDVLYTSAAPTVSQGEGGWMPIESAPKDGSTILAMLEDGQDTGMVYTIEWRDEMAKEEIKDGKGIGWRHSWDSYMFSGFDAPKYWMPLPSPPLEAKREGGEG